MTRPNTDTTKETTMKSLVLLSVLLAFLVMPTLAFAQCTQFTIHDLATGQMKICTQCCYGGQCQVTCL